MPKWIAAISGNDVDLAELQKSLVGPDLRVSHQQGSYVLESSRFDLLTTPEQVKNKANEILEVLSGASRVAFGLISPLSASWVATINDDGSRNVYMTATARVAFRDTASVVITREDGTVETINPADEVPRIAGVAEEYADAAEVLKLLAKGIDDWVNLYRIYEIIKRDTGGDRQIAEQGWATAARLNNFRHTANSPDSIGHEARHGVQTNEPPPTPMDISEAKTLIKHVAQKWLQSKVQPIVASDA